MAHRQQQSSSANRLWDEIQSIHEFPLAALLCLTGRCCMTCPHCFNDPQFSKEELPFDVILNLLNELQELGTLKFTISGGEPALSKNLFPVIESAARRNFDVSLKTSGFLFDSDSVSRLWDAGLNRMQISLYHTDPEKHDRFVGQSGAWHKAINAMDCFSKKGGRCSISILAMQWNASCVFDLLEFSENRGWGSVIDFLIMHRNDGSAAPCEFVVSENQLLSLLSNDRMPAFPIGPRKPTQPLCRAGVRGAFILPNGSVRTCPIFPWDCGNLREKSFKEIWLNSPVRERVLKLRWGDSQSCSDCADQSYCTRCPGEAVLEHCDPNKPATIDCFVAKARHKHANGSNETEHQ